MWLNKLSISDILHLCFGDNLIAEISAQVLRRPHIYLVPAKPKVEIIIGCFFGTCDIISYIINS